MIKKTAFSNDQPTCLLINGASSLGEAIAQNLKQKNIQVVTETPPNTLEYVICLTTNKKQVEEALALAHKHQAKFCFGSEVKNEEIELLVASISQKLNLDARILRLKDVYGFEASFENNSPFARLYSRLSEHEILLDSDQSQLVTPIFVKDAAELLVKNLFSRAARQKIFSLTGNESISLINIALKIQKIAEKSNIKLRLVSQEGSKKYKSETSPGQTLTPKNQTSLDDGLMQTIPGLLPQPKEEKKESQETVLLTAPRKNAHFHLETTPLSAPTPPSTRPNFSVGGSPTTSHVPASVVVNPPPLQPTKPKIIQAKKPILPNFSQVSMPKIPTIVVSQKSKSIGLIVGIICCIFIVSLGILLAPFILLSLTFGEANKLTLTDANTPKVEKIQKNLTSYLQLSQETLRFLADTNIFPALVRSVDSEVKLVELMIQSHIKTTEANKFLLTAVDRMLDTEEGDPFTAIDSSVSHFDSLYTTLSLATGSKATREFAQLSDHKGEGFLEKLPDFRQRLGITRQLLAATSYFLSPTQKTSYLILIQNNLELRPTGGFVSAIGVITFDKGKLLNIEVKDIYEADAALKGRVDPPPEVNTYLGESSWYLRDVNWDPNFPTTARNAQWFLEKELNRTVDGVIAINLHTLSSILEALGEVTVNGQSITAQNLEETAQYYQDVDFSSSPEKQELLGQIVLKIVDSVKTATPEQKLAVLNSLVKSALENQLLIATNDAKAMRVVSDLGMSGELINPSCPPSLKSSECLTDFLAVNEANVGINKANFYVARNHTHVVNISNSVIAHTHSLTLHNTAPNQSWPAGNYKTYIRFYVPSDSRLVRVLIDKAEVSPNKINVYNEHGKTVIGVFTEVPFNNFQTIEVSYQLPQVLPKISPVAYTFLMQKQSGTVADPLVLKITYPEGTSALAVSHEGIDTGTGTEITTTLEKNTFFAVELAK